MPRVLFVVLVAVAGLFSATATASAHASLITTSPTNGAHVDDAPSELRLDLNEPVTIVDGSAQLIDRDGARFDFSGVRLEPGGRTLVLIPAQTIPDGAYLATARVVSADTHVVSLSIQFTVGSVTQQGKFDTESAAGAEQYLNYPSKIATYVGLVLTAGVFLASCWVWRTVSSTSRYRLVYRIGGAIGVVGLLGRVLVLVAQQSGGLTSLSTTGLSTAVLTAHGVAIVLAAALSAVAAAVPSRGIAAAQAVAIILAVTLGGHGGSAGGWPWSFLATLLHVYGITVWLGGLAVMLLILRGTPRLDRWHRVAISHVALVLLAGVVLAILQVRPVAALWGTTYGLVLLAKVAAALVVLGLGYLTYRRYGRRTLAAEVGVAAVVLALTSVLSTVAPAKEVYTTDVATTLDFGSSDVLEIGIDSVRRGPQRITVVYPSADPAEVSIDLSSVAANVARLPVTLSDPAVESGSLVWRSDQLIVPAPGEWKVTVRFDGASGPKVASFFYDAL